MNKEQYLKACRPKQVIPHKYKYYKVFSFPSYKQGLGEFVLLWMKDLDQAAMPKN